MQQQYLTHAWDVARLRVQECGGVIDRTGLQPHWKLSKSSVQRYVEMDDFPAPLPGTEDRWLVAEVDHWKRDREERFG